MSLAKRLLDAKAGRGGRKAESGAMYAVMYGVDDVMKALQEVQISQRECYAIVTTVAQPLVAAIRSELPVKSGSLYRSIQVFRSKRDWYRKVWIGPRYIKGGGPDAGNHAHFLEYGTDNRTHLKDLLPGGITRSTYERFRGPWYFRPYAGKNLGATKAIGFMQKAYTNNKAKIQAEGNALLAEAFENAAKRKGFSVK